MIRFPIVVLCFVILAFASARTLSQSASPTEIFKRGSDALTARDYNLAVTEFTLYLQQKPKSAPAYFNRAIAYKGLNSRELAIEDLSKAIEFNPGNAKYHISRGLAYKELGRDDLALADNTKVIELEPSNASAYTNRAEIYMNRRQLDDALADVNKAIQLNDKTAKAFWVRANIYTIQAVWESALSDMKQAVTLDPTQKKVYHTIAWMEMHVGNDLAGAENAGKFLDAMGMKDDRAGWTLVAGYLAFLRAGEPDEAEKFIAKYPREEAAGVLPRKVLEYLRGKISEADVLAEAKDNVLSLNDSHSMIGLKLLLDGKKEEAIKHFTWVKQNGKKGPTTYALALVELAKLTAKKT